MIELGKTQKLEVIRLASIGAYLNAPDEKGDDDILLPMSQLPPDTQVGDEIDVFVYRDSEDRLISTVNTPKLTIDALAVLQVVDMTKIGAFLDWGIEKDLLLPFKEQVGELKNGSNCLVALYVDKSNRLCATMKVYELLSTQSPYKVNNWVSGTIYNINDEFGYFVAVDNKYHGMISKREMFGQYTFGDKVDVRVKKVRPDGKLELGVRAAAYKEIEGDAKKIMDMLKENNGKLLVCDKSSPEKIKAVLDMSKSAFKRAVGRLMKEGAIKTTDSSIEMLW